MKTTSGLHQVDVIYRRLDDEYLDPLVFKPDSALGVPGLISAYKMGNVALVNAVGNGVADDKAVYAYVPDMIKYYLNEEPILKNVPTYQMGNIEERELVFADMGNMVIKETNQSIQTDNEGRFVFKNLVKDSFTLTIKAIGFESKSIKYFKKNICLIIIIDHGLIVCKYMCGLFFVVESK